MSEIPVDEPLICEGELTLVDGACVAIAITEEGPIITDV